MHSTPPPSPVPAPEVDGYTNAVVGGVYTLYDRRVRAFVSDSGCRSVVDGQLCVFGPVPCGDIQCLGAGNRPSIMFVPAEEEAHQDSSPPAPGQANAADVVATPYIPHQTVALPGHVYEIGGALYRAEPSTNACIHATGSCAFRSRECGSARPSCTGDTAVSFVVFVPTEEAQQDDSSPAPTQEPQPVPIGALHKEHIEACEQYPDRIDLLGELWSSYCLAQDDYARVPALAHGSRMSAATGAFHDIPRYPGHACRPAQDDPMKVAFYATVRQLVENKRTVMRPGKYLAKFYGYLGEKRIKELAEDYAKRHAPDVLHVATSQADCIRAIAEGPTESCMANGYSGNTGDRGRYDWFAGHIHPAAVYGSTDAFTTDTEVIYIEDADGVVIARAVCNKHTKKCARPYGDINRLAAAMDRAGYTHERRALEGCRIQRIVSEYNDARLIMPYIDAGTASGGGCRRVHDEGDHIRIGAIGGDEGDPLSTYNAFKLHGVISLLRLHGEDEDENEDRTIRCDHCGEYHDHVAAYVEDIGDVCSGCIEENFVYARVRHGYAYILRDEAVYCEDNGGYYEESTADWHDVYECEYSGNWYFVRNLVITSRGYVHLSDAVSLDVADGNGNGYACPGDEVLLDDGRVVHGDSTVEDHYTSSPILEAEAISMRIQSGSIALPQYVSPLRYFSPESLAACADQIVLIGDAWFWDIKPERGAVTLGDMVRAYYEDGDDPSVGHPFFGEYRHTKNQTHSSRTLLAMLLTMEWDETDDGDDSLGHAFDLILANQPTEDTDALVIDPAYPVAA